MSLPPTTPVMHSTVVPVPPEAAFALYVDRPGRTHPAEGQSGRPSRIVYEPFAGGRWYELGADGTRYEWGRVLAWEPPARLTLAWMVSAATGAWSFDPDPTRASRVEITFTTEGDGTRVTVTHEGFERHGPTGGAIRWGVTAGWVEDLEDLRRAAVNHSPAAPGRADTAPPQETP